MLNRNAKTVIAIILACGIAAGIATGAVPVGIAIGLVWLLLGGDGQGPTCGTA